MGTKDSYSINGEIDKKNAHKRRSFKYDILGTIIALSKGSLLYQTFSMYHINMYMYYMCVSYYMYYMYYV